MSSSARRIYSVVLALALLASAGVAGGQAEGRPDALPTPVAVTITETTLVMPSALPPGLFSFQVTNAGNRAHDFEIGGKGMKTGFGLNLDPGETRALRVYLAPGSYTAYCPIEDHAHPTVSLDVRYAERIR